MTWKTVYESTDQTIEQRVVGVGENATVEERVTWHRQTPEKQIADLEATVTALTEQATGKITKAQLTARLDAAKQKLDPWATLTYPQGAATVGDKRL